MANIIIGISGGIAAYKSAYLASGMVRRGFDVRAVMTDGACRFITPLTFKGLTGNRVYTSLWDEAADKDHTALSEWADTMIVAPATANEIAKFANGIADNLLSTLILDFTGPVFLCPAMHENMWNNPANRKNIEFLKENRYYIIGPEKGNLAGGKTGEGRMTEPETIISTIETILNKEYPAIIKQ
ncbi:MAG: flavoprotein [Elusimicrobiota bacterium]